MSLQYARSFITSIYLFTVFLHFLIDSFILQFYISFAAFLKASYSFMRLSCQVVHPASSRSTPFPIPSILLTIGNNGRSPAEPFISSRRMTFFYIISLFASFYDSVACYLVNQADSQDPSVKKTRRPLSFYNLPVHCPSFTSISQHCNTITKNIAPGTP